MIESKKLTKTPEKSAFEYNGKFNDHQLYGNNFHGKRYSIVEEIIMTDYQNFLYNRALFGLSVYSQDELKDMRWDKRKRITKVHKRTQHVINIWKQQVVNLIYSKLISLFPKMESTKHFVDMTDDTDPEHMNRMSFKTLCITKVEVVKKLITEGILPPNFHELKTPQTCN